jgi:predicted regulator of Ras-like GTPase activity (Roadblock/LC7/MglB family)
MQAGKVLFSWNEVASWIRPPLAIPPTHKVGEMAVELPLKVIAPLFMAHHRVATQKRVAVDQSIPNLFGGIDNVEGQAQVTQPSPPSGTVREDFEPPIQVRGVAQTQPKMTISGAGPSVRPLGPKLETIVRVDPLVPNDETTLEQIIGASGNRFTAKEIVGNASRLPSVMGVLLAMSDGLLVISHTPPSIKAETIAAFLPQMFGRMNQYAKELALGPLHQLTLGVDSGQWNVFKADAIYFAVLGKRSETLPLNLLAQVAAELSSQSK